MMVGVKRSRGSPETEELSSNTNVLKPNGVFPDVDGELDITENPSMLKPRGYQEEMLAESLRQNIIIAVSSS
jgi:hypothetical protein